MRYRFLAGVCLLLGSLQAQQLAQVETEHYALSYEGPQAEAEAYGEVLEAAWEQFADYFGAKPRLRKRERLMVEFLANEESWAEAMRADNVGVPRGAGGYYWPENRTIYLFRQPTPYYSRQLLIHEACHQFHYLARANNRHIPQSWYVEGLAEYLAHHTWDGQQLELAVLPRVTLKDSAASALESLADGEPSLAALVAGNDYGYAEYWAVVRFLHTVKKGRLRKRFGKLAKQLDAGGGPGAFADALGPPEALQAAFLEWLQEEQQPMLHVFNLWEDLGDGRLQGSAEEVSFCAFKTPLQQVQARVSQPAGEFWRVGLLLDYTADDWTVGFATSNGRLKVQRLRAGSWEFLLDEPLPVQKDYVFRAVRSGAQVMFEVGGDSFGPFELNADGLMGVAVDKATVVFEEVEGE